MDIIAPAYAHGQEVKMSDEKTETFRDLCIRLYKETQERRRIADFEYEIGEKARRIQEVAVSFHQRFGYRLSSIDVDQPSLVEAQGLRFDASYSGRCFILKLIGSPCPDCGAAQVSFPVFTLADIGEQLLQFCPVWHDCNRKSTIEPQPEPHPTWRDRLIETLIEGIREEFFR